MKSLFLFLMLPVFCCSQQSEQVIYESEIDPAFPDGHEAMMQYIEDNLDYPEFNLDEGTVYVQFLVDSSGIVKDAAIVKSVTKSMDAAALKLVSSMPNWIPATRGNKKVSATMTIPVKFILPVYDFVEVDPQFPGGHVAMAQFIQDNFEYPEEAREDGDQGIVYVTFVVEKDGSITYAKIRKGVHESLNAEALRLINKMPKWTPAEQAGKPVRVNFTLPIHFRIASETPKEPAIPLTKKEHKKYDKKVKKAEKIKAKHLKKQQKGG
jgi:TonB family protein